MLRVENERQWNGAGWRYQAATNCKTPTHELCLPLYHWLFLIRWIITEYRRVVHKLENLSPTALDGVGWNEWEFQPWGLLRSTQPT